MLPATTSRSSARPCANVSGKIPELSYIGKSSGLALLELSFRGDASASNPESRDSGSGASHHPGMTAVEIASKNNERHHSLRRHQQGAAGFGRQRPGAVPGLAGSRALVLG